MIKISVTEEDVSLARLYLKEPEVCRTRVCPIALAVRRATKADEVRVMNACNIEVDDRSFYPDNWWKVKKFIHWFDIGEGGKPSFPLKFSLLRRKG